MSGYTLAPTAEIIGHSTWPFDPLYLPVVGLFVGGVLQETSVCRHLHEEIVISSLGLQTRIKRRLLRALGRPVPAMIVMPKPQGPELPVWFRMPVAPDLARRLAENDPQIRLERLEDSEPILPMRDAAEPPPPQESPVRVEALLNAPAAATASRLDGFKDFLSAPAQFQLEAMFVEYLRRMPERTARDTYLPQLERGAINAIDLRGFILGSDEFRGRRTRLGARVGSGVTGGLWRRFAASPTLLEPHRALPEATPDDFKSLDEEAYRGAVGARILGRTPTVAEDARFKILLDRLGRRDGAREIARWGAREGRFFRVD